MQASREEVEKYAAKKYGATEYNRTVELSGNDALQHYFTDKEYDFEYYVTSSVNDVVIDGSKFGETESKASNFNKVYYTYILGQIQGELDTLASQYDTRTYWEDKEVAVYDTFNEWLGSYSYKYDKWMTPSDMDDTHFIEIITMWNSKATYLRSPFACFESITTTF